MSNNEINAKDILQNHGGGGGWGWGGGGGVGGGGVGGGWGGGGVGGGGVGGWGGCNGKDFTQLFNGESYSDEIDLIYHSP